MKGLELENECRMTQPNNEKIAEALENFAEGDVQPNLQPALEPPDQTGSELPPQTFQATDAQDADPSEIIETDEPLEEADEILMTPAPGEETVESSSRQFLPIRQNRPPLYQTMTFRQTIIPVLLTCGVLTLATSSLKFAAGPDSIFSDLPLWLPITLLLAGVILLLLAVLNMLAVKHAR
jgi:hypothetical protein